MWQEHPWRLIFPKTISIPPFTLILSRIASSIVKILGQVHKVLSSLSVSMQLLYTRITFLQKKRNNKTNQSEP